VIPLQVGRFVTVQRSDDGVQKGAPLNLVELAVTSVPAAAPTTDVMLLETEAEGSPTSQCPATKPFAYKDGTSCCSHHTERSNMTSDLASGWSGQLTHGILTYNSDNCGGSSTACSSPPCLNHGLRHYGCFIEGVDLDSCGRPAPISAIAGRPQLSWSGPKLRRQFHPKDRPGPSQR
jgi:hypothetical protein